MVSQETSMDMQSQLTQMTEEICVLQQSKDQLALDMEHMQDRYVSSYLLDKSTAFRIL